MRCVSMTFRASVVIMLAVSATARAGMDEFKGKIFHTARWDYDYTGGEWGRR